MKKSVLLLFILNITLFQAQNNSYWQQHVNYKMDIDMDVNTYQYKGKQQLIYTNNSSDELRKVFLSFVLQRISAKQ